MAFFFFFQYDSGTSAYKSESVKIQNKSKTKNGCSDTETSFLYVTLEKHNYNLYYVKTTADSKF